MGGTLRSTLGSDTSPERHTSTSRSSQKLCRLLTLSTQPDALLCCSSAWQMVSSSFRQQDPEPGGTAWDSSSSLIGTPGGVLCRTLGFVPPFPPTSTAAGQHHLMLLLTQQQVLVPQPLYCLPTMLPPVTVLHNGPDSTTFLPKNP